ncbi:MULTISPECIES: MFS transporter [Martelella]|uniref:Enterobactin exporter EntS n=1 Tax=Martelella mediterranea DSM 17316 TaxID=1122214 RepID=A0A1U9Z6Q2_9HYPH|nr:MFS transporter [Martelella mediterranea]AQZ53387.1 enterobactin exporter EntS [Martelella mediterranea DSM 17316]
MNKATPSLFAPFAHTTFRNIWFASIASNLGTNIQNVGAAWMMTSISNSESMVALVQASTTLPVMLFALVAGAIADSFDRRRVILAAQGFMFAVSVALALAAVAGVITPWMLLAFTFLIGSGNALNNPSWQAAVGDMVPRSDVPGAVTVNSVGFNITRSVGPAVGGTIVAIGGAAAAFVVNALSYLGLLTVVFRWKFVPPENPLPREKMTTAIGAGLRYVFMSPNILKVLLRAFLFGLATVSALALLPLVARDVIAGGPQTFGIMLGAFGIGAIGGAFANARLRAALSNEAIIRAAFLVFGASAVVMSLSTSLIIDCLALFFAGACWVMALSLFNTVVQLTTPRWVVGRALSLYQTAAFGGMAGGSWLWGYVAENLTITHAFLAAAGVAAFGAAVGFVFKMPAFESLNLDPLNRFRTPEPALGLVARSGPIVVETRFVIAAEDTQEFLRLMVERRRIRLRDGARKWALMRDIEEPDVWFETYHAPTWVDYVRHNQRRTQADADNFDRLRELHREDGMPRVRRMIERQAIPPRDTIFNRPYDAHHHHH